MANGVADRFSRCDNFYVVAGLGRVGRGAAGSSFARDDAELGEDHGEVVLDGAGAEEEFGADLEGWCVALAGEARAIWASWGVSTILRVEGAFAAFSPVAAGALGEASADPVTGAQSTDRTMRPHPMYLTKLGLFCPAGVGPR